MVQQRRYIRKPEQALSRTQCSEQALSSIVHKIRALRQSQMSKEKVAKIKAEETQEEEEIQVYIVRALIEGIIGTAPGSRSSDRSSASKVPSALEEMASNPATSR